MELVISLDYLWLYHWQSWQKLAIRIIYVHIRSELSCDDFGHLSYSNYTLYMAQFWVYATVSNTTSRMSCHVKNILLLQKQSWNVIHNFHSLCSQWILSQLYLLVFVRTPSCSMGSNSSICDSSIDFNSCGCHDCCAAWSAFMSYHKITARRWPVCFPCITIRIYKLAHYPSFHWLL